MKLGDAVLKVSPPSGVKSDSVPSKDGEGRYLTVQDLKSISDAIYARQEGFAGRLRLCANRLKFDCGHRADVYFHVRRGAVHLDINPDKGAVSDRAADAWKSCFEDVPEVKTVTMERGATPWGETKRPDNWHTLSLDEPVKKGLTPEGRRRHLAEARKHWTGKDPVCPECGAEYEWAGADELGQEKGKCNRCGSDKEPVEVSELPDETLEKGASGVYNHETGRMEWSGEGDAGKPKESILSRVKVALTKPSTARPSVSTMSTELHRSLPESVHSLEGVRHVQSGKAHVTTAGYAYGHQFAAKSARAGAAQIGGKLKADGWTVGPHEKVGNSLHRHFVAKKNGVAVHITVQHRGSSWERSQGLPGGTQVRVRGIAAARKKAGLPKASSTPASPAPEASATPDSSHTSSGAHTSLDVPSLAQATKMNHVTSVTHGGAHHHYLTHRNPQAQLLALREQLPASFRAGRISSSRIRVDGGHAHEYRFHAHDPATGHVHKFYSIRSF